MKISELIKLLEEVKEKEGDLECFYESYCEVQGIEVVEIEDEIIVNIDKTKCS